MSLDHLLKKDLVDKAHLLGLSVRGTKADLRTRILSEEAERRQRRVLSEEAERRQILEPELEPEEEEYVTAPQIRRREAGNSKTLSEHNGRKRKTSRSSSYSSSSSESDSDSSSSSSVSNRRSRSREKKRSSGIRRKQRKERKLSLKVKGNLLPQAEPLYECARRIEKGMELLKRKRHSEAKANFRKALKVIDERLADIRVADAHSWKVVNVLKGTSNIGGSKAFQRKVERAANRVAAQDTKPSGRGAAGSSTHAKTQGPGRPFSQGLGGVRNRWGPCFRCGAEGHIARDNQCKPEDVGNYIIYNSPIHPNHSLT